MLSINPKKTKIMVFQKRARKCTECRLFINNQIIDVVHDYMYLEGPEGVKWELGLAYFCTGKMGFGSLGLGITNTKLGMGNLSRNYTAYVVNVQ